MESVVTGLLVLVGIIHLLPVSGVLGVKRLAALYGVSLGEPNPPPDPLPTQALSEGGTAPLREGLHT